MASILLTPTRVLSTSLTIIAHNWPSTISLSYEVVLLINSAPLTIITIIIIIVYIIVIVIIIVLLVVCCRPRVLNDGVQ